jgi:ribose transport system substrate-binding protein
VALARKGVAMLAVLAVALLAAACNREDGGGAGARWEREIVIGWAPPDITGVFKTATEFFEKSAAEANAAGFKVKIETRSPSRHTDAADQVAIIDDFITRKVDVIAVSPSDTEAIKPAIQRANQASIPVIYVNLLEEQSGVDVAASIGFDNAQAASVSAYAVLDWLGGPGVLGAGEKANPGPDQYLDLAWWENLYSDVDTDSIKGNGAIIEGIAGTFFSQARLQGFNKVIERYPNVKIQGNPIPADWNREKGVEATETFLSRFKPGSELGFIWAASNEMGLGASLTADRRGVLAPATAVEEGPADDKVGVFTNDVTPESVAAIKEGKLLAETHHGFAEWGWFGTQFAVTLACGQEVPKLQDIKPRTVWQGNADQFYPNIALPEIDWASIKAGCN